MFYNCTSLSYLPDISKWNISKIKSMKCFFSGCSSLVYLPDISKWNLSEYDYINKLNIKYIDCISISYLPLSHERDNLTDSINCINIKEEESPYDDYDFNDYNSYDYDYRFQNNSSGLNSNNSSHDDIFY